jgi:glycosyltransferase involved in cell wall biosynthesis
MKVLMLARPNLLTYPGGDTTQVLNTAKALRDLGVAIDINPEQPDYKRYDLLHFFNIIDPEDILGHLRRSRLPFVLSTVYCLYEEYDRHHRRDPVGWAYRLLPRDGVEYLKTVAKWMLKSESLSSYEFLWRGHGGSIRHILRRAACLLPNSESEYRRLVADYGIERPYVVVPNGVDLDRFSPKGTGNRSIVLCVSRIEGRKNQVNLIRAVNETDLELYLVGLPAQNQQAYYEKCRRLAGDKVHFTGYLPFDTLLEYYERARVHALPSWFETTGLSSLEASLMGCNVVVGDRGDVRDYFREDAWYCDPADPASIREAVLAAFEAPHNETLPQRIRTRYNWANAAQRTVEGYRMAMA